MRFIWDGEETGMVPGSKMLRVKIMGEYSLRFVE